MVYFKHYLLIYTKKQGGKALFVRDKILQHLFSFDWC